MPWNRKADAEIEDHADFAMRTLTRLAQHIEGVPGSGDLLRDARECVAYDAFTRLSRRMRSYRRRLRITTSLLVVALVALAYHLGYLDALFK